MKQLTTCTIRQRDYINVRQTPEQTKHCHSLVAFHNDKHLCHDKAGAVAATNQVVLKFVKKCNFKL